MKLLNYAQYDQTLLTKLNDIVYSKQPPFTQLTQMALIVLMISLPCIRKLNGFVDLDNPYAKADGKPPPVVILKTQVIMHN